MGILVEKENILRPDCQLKLLWRTLLKSAEDTWVYTLPTYCRLTIWCGEMRRACLQIPKEPICFIWSDSLKSKSLTMRFLSLFIVQTIEHQVTTSIFLLTYSNILATKVSFWLLKFYLWCFISVIQEADQTRADNHYWEAKWIALNRLPQRN